MAAAATMPSPFVTTWRVIWCFVFSIAPSISRSLPATTDCVLDRGLRERARVERDLEPAVDERPERLRDRLLQRRVQVAAAGADATCSAGAPAPHGGLGLLADHRRP